MQDRFMQDRFLKRLRKKAKRGMRGYPLATVAFYGPDLTRSSKAVVGIVVQQGGAAVEMRDWKRETGDVRVDPVIAEEMLAFMDGNGVVSVVLVDRNIGCSHQEGVDYHGKWCPACTFWIGRDRYSGKMLEP
jgi:hypothetical protein